MGQFRTLVEQASRILITSHYNPDPDAVGSALGLYNVLSRHYPAKKWCICLDGGVGQFATSFENITAVLDQKPSQIINEQSPDLVIFTDASGYSRFESEGGDSLKNSLESTKPRLIGIDHHEIVSGWEESMDLYHNKLSSSASEDVASILVSEGYTVTKQEYLIFLVGMIADTGRFLYPNNNPKQTWRVLDQIYSSGLQMQDANVLLEDIKLFYLQVIAAFIGNIITYPTVNMSFLTDNQVDTLSKLATNGSEFRQGTHGFINQYLRQINGVQFGVVIFKSPEKPGFYKGSLRSDARVNCNTIAVRLGGGGHKGAAAFEFASSDLESAKKLVLNALKNSGILIDDTSSVG